MIRILIYAILAYLLFRVIRGLFPKSRHIGKGERGGVIDEMVQDPQCGTYIPKRDAVNRVIGGEDLFFCSKRCASDFELRKEAKK